MDDESAVCRMSTVTLRKPQSSEIRADFLSGDFTVTEGCGSTGRLERIPDAHTDVTTHCMSVMEAGGMTLVSEVLKVTHQVLALWDWLPAAVWSAHIAFDRIGEPSLFAFRI